MAVKIKRIDLFLDHGGSIPVCAKHPEMHVRLVGVGVNERRPVYISDDKLTSARLSEWVGPYIGSYIGMPQPLQQGHCPPM